MTPRPSRYGRAWLLIPVAFLALYLVSFTGFPVIERTVSIVGEADAASYSILYREFELDTPIGNPFNLDGRSLADVAQKHKLHHVVSAAAGHGIYVVAAPVYRVLGMPEGWAVYLPGAFVGALNIVLLALLLRGDNPHGNSVVPFVILYGVSLSPWLYAAVPDSWPLTAALFWGFCCSRGTNGYRCSGWQFCSDSSCSTTWPSRPWSACCGCASGEQKGSAFA